MTSSWCQKTAAAPTTETFKEPTTGYTDKKYEGAEMRQRKKEPRSYAGKKANYSTTREKDNNMKACLYSSGERDSNSKI